MQQTQVSTLPRGTLLERTCNESSEGYQAREKVEREELHKALNSTPEDRNLFIERMLRRISERRKLIDRFMDPATSHLGCSMELQRDIEDAFEPLSFKPISSEPIT